MRKRGKGGWRHTTPDPATIGPMLRKAGFVASDVDPVRVSASFDHDGRPRRIHARYPDGWTCLLNLSLDGSYTLSQSLRMRIVGRQVALS